MGRPRSVFTLLIPPSAFTMPAKPSSIIVVVDLGRGRLYRLLEQRGAWVEGTRHEVGMVVAVLHRIGM
jgi:hypothetical protein